MQNINGFSSPALVRCQIVIQVFSSCQLLLTKEVSAEMLLGFCYISVAMFVFLEFLSEGKTIWSGKEVKWIIEDSRCSSGGNGGYSLLSFKFGCLSRWQLSPREVFLLVGRKVNLTFQEESQCLMLKRKGRKNPWTTEGIHRESQEESISMSEQYSGAHVIK